MELADVDENESGDRWYVWSDGERYPSVTTITSSDPEKRKRIEEWKRTTPGAEEYRDRQGTLGSIVHYRILDELAIRQIEPPKVDLSYVDDEMDVDIQMAIDLWEQVDLDPGESPHVEEPVRSDEHAYSGRFDLLTEDGFVCDLKVSPAVWDSYRMQAAAYAHAINEMGRDFPRARGAKIIVLHPNPENNPTLTPTVETLSADKLDHFFSDFLALRKRFSDSRG